MCFRGIALRQVFEDDLDFLFHLFCNPTRSHLWMRSGRVLDEREFYDGWRSWITKHMGAKFIVATQGQPAGLIYDYDRAGEGGHTRVTALLDAEATGRGVGVIAWALFVEWLFHALPLRKIYFDVYGYNTRVVQMLRKLGLAEEGVFPHDCFWSGTSWPRHVFAVYRETWPGPRARLLRAPGARASRDVGEGKEVIGTGPEQKDGCLRGAG
jgi:RimJ/RimL family protein N-acetyltransferase